MGRNVDIDEVRDMRDQILRVLDDKFKGVYHRQDIANGRTNKLEEFAGETRGRLEAVERETEAFHLHRRATDPQPIVAPAPVAVKSSKDGNSRRITLWDVRLVGYGAVGAAGLIKLLPWLVSLAQTGKP